MNKELIQKEIYADRKYCLYHYQKKRIQALYWKIKKNYYSKKHMKEFLSKEN